MARTITNEEWLEWREHDITQLFFSAVVELREETLQALANGVYSEEPGKQAIMIGKINAFTKVLETRWGENGIQD